MSTVIWVNYLRDGKVSSDESDKWALYRFAGKLDRLCSKLGLPPLSGFHDTTDARANLEPETGDGTEIPNTWETMAETGDWYFPDDGLRVIEALLAELERNPVRFGFFGDRYGDVVAELKEARASIARAKTMEAQFHLCVVL